MTQESETRLPKAFNQENGIDRQLNEVIFQLPDEAKMLSSLHARWLKVPKLQQPLEQFLVDSAPVPNLQGIALGAWFGNGFPYLNVYALGDMERDYKDKFRYPSIAGQTRINWQKLRVALREIDPNFSRHCDIALYYFNLEDGVFREQIPLLRPEIFNSAFKFGDVVIERYMEPDSSERALITFATTSGITARPTHRQLNTNRK
jgi:hypothetical protein